MELRLERLDEAGVTVNQFVLLFLIESNLIPKCVEKKFDDLLKLQENLFIKILEDRIVLRPKGTQLIPKRLSMNFGVVAFNNFVKKIKYPFLNWAVKLFKFPFSFVRKN